MPDEGDDKLYMPLCGISRCCELQDKQNISRECVLEYIVAGSGVLQTSYATYTPAKGDVYILHRGSTHEYWTDKDDCWTKVWFNIQGSLIDELLRIYGLEKVEYFPMAELRQPFETCLELMKQNLDNAHQTATLITHRLIYEISRKVYSNDSSTSNPSAIAVKKWIDRHFDKPLLLESLGVKFNMSVSQLIRVFEKEYGETPYKYYLTRKLDYAKIMLRNTRKDRLRTVLRRPILFSNVFKKKNRHRRWNTENGNPICWNSLKAVDRAGIFDKTTRTTEKSSCLSCLSLLKRSNQSRRFSYSEQAEHSASCGLAQGTCTWRIFHSRCHLSQTYSMLGSHPGRESNSTTGIVSSAFSISAWAIFSI